MNEAVAITPSAQVRSAVWEGHRRAERHPLMRHLLSQKVGPEDHAAYLSALLPLYQALEAGIASSDSPFARLFSDQCLSRTARIRADIDVLTETCGRRPPSNSATALPPLIGSGDPLALAAMGYIRYFGDLAGGQAMGRHLGKQLGISLTRGGQFFAFDLPTGQDAPAYLNNLREQLDALLDDSGTKAEFIENAVADFEWHLLVFDSVWETINDDGN